MSNFLEIKCLEKEEQEKILKEIDKRISEKKKEGLLTEREIQEIEEMRLHPLPDILDVQSVYKDILFKKKTKGKK
jgi:2-oxo-4-hydroxy-4-carboxy--5-ureidoimidazoline (OHCU) decarboxylase